MFASPKRLMLSGLCALFVMSSSNLMAQGTGTPPGDDDDDSPPHLSKATRIQLAGVREATRKYKDLDAALADGYADISVFVPHMGYHYLKAEILDDRFEADEPELLVYSVDPCSQKPRLVAVEYAVPLSLAKRAPKGFNGDADVWEVNEEFQLWTLHAWVWMHNPDGVFAALNPDVP